MRLKPRADNGIYMLTYTDADGKRQRVSTGERDRAAAEKRAAVIMSSVSADSKSEGWTLADALTDTYERVWAAQKTPTHTHQRMMKLIRTTVAGREAGFRPLDLVTYDWLIELTESLAAAGAKDATINRYLALVSKALTEAVKRGRLTVKPPLPYRKESAGKLRWLTWAEQDQLMDKALELWPLKEAEEMRALITVLADTGGRLSEVLKVPRLSRGQVTFMETKNGKSRSVPLTEAAQAALPKVPFWTVQQAIGRFSRLRDACGMHDVTLHTLRHTCASRLVQGGMDLYRVQTWLGHSSMAVTMRYAHLAPSSLSAGTDILTRQEGA